MNDLKTAARNLEGAIFTLLAEMEQRKDNTISNDQREVIERLAKNVKSALETEEEPESITVYASNNLETHPFGRWQKERDNRFSIPLCFSNE